jgi:hypothetical protein
MEERMRRSRHKWWSVATVAVVVTGAACSRTKLEVTAHGGFAYIQSEDKKRVDIAFLKSVNNPDCVVDQLGAELMVDDGKVIEPADGQTKFELSGYVVSFENANNSGVTVIGGPDRPSAPFHPVDPRRDDDWKDAKWVPYTRPNYSGNKLRADWQSMVGGWVKLTQGVVNAGKPSDGAAVLGTWKFKRASDTTTFEQSISDRVNYAAWLRGNRIVINLVDAKSGVQKQKIVIEPLDKRKTVGLMLRGKHPPQTPGQINVGDPIAHFCAFYELLDPKPTKAEQLIPHYNGVPSTSPMAQNLPPGGQPTPGAYCPGDWP